MSCRPNRKSSGDNPLEQEVNKLLDRLQDLGAAVVCGVTLVSEEGRATHVFAINGDDILCRGLASRLESTLSQGRTQGE